VSSTEDSTNSPIISHKRRYGIVYSRWGTQLSTVKKGGLLSPGSPSPSALVRRTHPMLTVAVRKGVPLEIQSQRLKVSREGHDLALGPGLSWPNVVLRGIGEN